jgi:hypothetical protein
LVTANAAAPNASCRKPDTSELRPVSSVIAAPIANRPSAESPSAVTTAVVSERKTNGRIGTTAPTTKRTNDMPAATHGEPPSSSGSMPSSSRAWVSSAVSGSAESRSATFPASAG